MPLSSQTLDNDKICRLRQDREIAGDLEGKTKVRMGKPTRSILAPADLDELLDIGDFLRHCRRRRADRKRAESKTKMMSLSRRDR